MSDYFGGYNIKNSKNFLTFEDVLLVPRRSDVYSRRDAVTKTQFTKNIFLNTPLVSANMDTVTESEMAKAMAHAGGIGIIHRFMTKEAEATEVEKVKRSEGVLIDKPHTIHPTATLKEARKLMADKGVSGIIVVDEKNKVIGILTRRDVVFEMDEKKLVRDLMTKKVITTTLPLSIDKVKSLLGKYKIEKLPVVGKGSVLKGLVTATDLVKKALYPEAVKDGKGKLLVGAAIGVNEDYLERAGMLVDAGCDVLVVDVAHGHNDRAIKALKDVRKNFKHVEIVAGNVATPQGTVDLIKAGADAIKVGIGPGATCITRIVTGVGVPQLTAIQLCSTAAKKYGVPIIGDGGIKNSGDMSKAIAGGASTVMVGSILSGTKESPGEYIFGDGVAYKIYRGGASRESFEDKLLKENKKSDGLYRAPEGKSGKVAYKGEVSVIIQDILAGFRSSMSYLGAHDVPTFQKNAEFIRITEGGMRESKAHKFE